MRCLQTVYLIYLGLAKITGANRAEPEEAFYLNYHYTHHTTTLREWSVVKVSMEII